MSMKKNIIFCIILLFFTGCKSICNLDRSCVSQRNRDNLNLLEIGMSKNDVLDIMGKPYQREAFSDTEALLYLTNHSAYVSDSERYTPVVFKNERLAGWGRNFWTYPEQKYDIKIDQRVKQE
ncbi:MAG: DUF3192 domain-containing protein [Phycisphaerae bacterium]|nr:DUF3192 domain-containing protein [Phycisphaerae bacterium]